MAKGKGFLTGIIIGGLLGAIATVAIVPELDEETRKRLRDEAARVRERARDWSAKARAEADVLVDQGRTLLASPRARFEDALAQGKEAAAEKQRELRQKFSQAEQEGEAQL